MTSNNETPAINDESSYWEDESWRWYWDSPSFWRNPNKSQKQRRRRSDPPLGQSQTKLPVNICPFCGKPVTPNFGCLEAAEFWCEEGCTGLAHSGLRSDCALGCFEQHLHDTGFCHDDPHCHQVSDKDHCREVHHFSQGAFNAPDTPRPDLPCPVCGAKIVKIRYIHEVDFTVPSEFELEIKQNERDWKARQKRDKNMDELKTGGKPFTLQAYVPNLDVFGLRDLCGLDHLGDGQRSISNLQTALIEHLSPSFQEVRDAPVDPKSGLILFPPSVFKELDEFVLRLTVRNPIRQKKVPDPSVTLPHPEYCNESFTWHFCPNLIAGNPCSLIHPWSINWAYMDAPDGIGLVPQVRNPISHMSVINAYHRAYQFSPTWQ